MARNDQDPSLVRTMAPMAAWWGAEIMRDKTRSFLKQSERVTGLSTRASKIPGMPFSSGKLKPWSTFQADMVAKEASIEGLAAKKAFKSQATRLFGASRVEALLSRGLGIANVMVLAPMLYGMSYHGFKGIQRLGFELERPELGGHMTLNSMAFTDRQRSIQAMHNSEFNGRSSVGQEAFLLHQ